MIKTYLQGKKQKILTFSGNEYFLDKKKQEWKTVTAFKEI